MNKNTQIIIGLAAVTGVGYLIWKQTNQKKPAPQPPATNPNPAFANLFGRRKRRRRSQTVYGNTGGSSPVGSPIFTSEYGYGYGYGSGTIPPQPKGGSSTY